MCRAVFGELIARKQKHASVRVACRRPHERQPRIDSLQGAPRAAVFTHQPSMGFKCSFAS